MKNFFFNSCREGVLFEASYTALRVFAGLAMALAHGWGKLPVSEQFVTGVAQLGFPAPALFAWAAALAEFGGGILVAVGLLTRPAALTVAFTMLVAAFLQHGNDPFKFMELSLLYLVINSFFAVKGGGKWSLDNVFYGKQ